ncbi:N-6 DNA methylase [Mesonia sp.]|uniref:N-6 DNA methylase n=1 Tax=Mesonia sp. TaxID=1960830 RepID=UPI003F974449
MMNRIKEVLRKKKELSKCGLPANVFYSTSIPTCILMLKKCRENPDDILFIDSSEHFEKVKTQNIITYKNIDETIRCTAGNQNQA